MRPSALHCALWAAVGFLLLSPACGTGPTAVDDYRTQVVRLPDRTEIRAEVVTEPADMMKGLMFRDKLPQDRGMLFVHDRVDNYSYWMYQVRIPLDIIWMDSSRRIVEISADTPPCKGEASECPTYGGNKQAQFILELAGGEAGKHGLQLGDTLSF